MQYGWLAYRRDSLASRILQISYTIIESKLVTFYFRMTNAQCDMSS